MTDQKHSHTFDLSHMDPSAMKMGFGAGGAWFLVGVDWMNEHSGFFVAVSAIVTTGIAIWGAFERRTKNRIAAAGAEETEIDAE